MIKIELWSDFACPFCYIGKTKFEKALEKFSHKEEVKLIYKAYQLNPYAPKEMTTTPQKAFAESHNLTETQALERFKMFTENAKQVGLEYNYDIIQMTNTFDAHRLAKYAYTKNKESDLTSRFMKAYFTEGLNLADKETLIKLSVEIGLDKQEVEKVLNGTDYSELVKNQMLESQEVGVQGVPYFVINRKYAISGAQPEEYFFQALEFVWNEINQDVENNFKESKNDSVCTYESCEV